MGSTRAIAPKELHLPSAVLTSNPMGNSSSNLPVTSARTVPTQQSQQNFRLSTSNASTIPAHHRQCHRYHTQYRSNCYRLSGCPLGDNRQQHGHIEARPSLHLLREIVFPQIRAENSHSNSHRVQAAQVQILLPTIWRSVQFEQTRSIACARRQQLLQVPFV